VHRRVYVEGLKGSAINAGQHDTDQPQHRASIHSNDFPAISIDEHLWAVLKAASISVLNQDRTLRYTWASGPLAGYPVDCILSKTDSDLFEPGDALRLAELKRRALEGGMKAHEEAEILANDDTFVFDIFIEPLRNDNGEIVGITNAFRDITEQRRTRKDLQRAKAAADAAMRAKAEFLAIMSHEIRTPLNAIVGMAGLLQDDELTADQRECADTIRSSGEALLEIISNILDLSKIERGYTELERQPFNLAACIKDALDLMEQKAIAKGLKLTFSLDGALPGIVTGDVNRIRQVLVNLLDNAIKFTDHGGASVCAKQFSVDTEIYELQFSVTDTGVGIPPDRMNRLFQTFSQVDMSSTRRYGGAGLGLAISKRLVELMGGRIWAQSEVQKGSAFHFTVPLYVKEDRSPHLSLPSMPLQEIHTNQRKALRILIAEDNLVNQRVMLRMLNKLGYRADAVANGFEVLKALQRQPYDLVLMDVQMPEMDGIEATRRIRHLWPAGGPRIIAVTAYALEGDRERCIESGMDGYIAKPVNLDTLKGAIEKNSLKIGQKKLDENGSPGVAVPHLVHIQH
jgi:PAS domain S-box-containing protein